MSIKIITPRLIIRTPVMEDVSAIHAAKQKVWHSLQRWMSWASDDQKTLSATEQFVTRANSRNLLIGLCRASGDFVVSTGIHPRDGYENQLEAGYWVAENFLGNGFATEACNAVVRYAFNALSIPEVYICHHDGNIPSQKIIEKLGFTKTGVRKRAFRCLLDSTVLDTHEYIMRDPAALPPLDVRW